MNVILLDASELDTTVTLSPGDRRSHHICKVLKSTVGDKLTIGVIGGRLGTGNVGAIGDGVVISDLQLDREPPLPLPITLILALPRPKVLNRVIASITSMGVKEIHLINSWRVEKSYWKSPRLDGSNLRRQALFGLEQAVDTVEPTIHSHRLFKPFVDELLAEVSGASTRLVAHPYGTTECPRAVGGRVTLAVGPEGGFIEKEIESLVAQKFSAVHMGPRVLRVETAVTALISRLAS